MRPSIYFFGEMSDGVKSYPTDHTIDFFNNFIRRSRNELQIVLHRKDNLLYYSYIRKIQNNNSFGICICLDCLYKDITRLFTVFDGIFSRLMEKGELIRLTSSGQIIWATTSLADEPVVIMEYSDEIIRQLGIGPSNTQPLPPVNFSVSINDCLESGLESLDIVDAINKYSNIYIVKRESEIEKVESYKNTLSEKDTEIHSLNQKISSLEEENLKLLRKKKQYKLVIFLSILVVVGVVIILLFNQHVNELRNEVGIQKYSIDTLQIVVNDKTKELSASKAKLSEVSTKLETTTSFLSDLSKYVPLVVSDIEVKNEGENYGDRIYSSNTTYIYPKLTVYSLIDGDVDFYVKFYSPNGYLHTYSDSPKGYTYKDNVSLTKYINSKIYLAGYGGTKKGHWRSGDYRIEVWYNNTCLKTKVFTIY